MTITELQIQLDIHFDDKVNILEDVASEVDEGFFFVDSEDGHCYLFDEFGNLDDIAKVKTLKEKYIKKDIKKIVIPNNIMSIESYVFDRCSWLTSVTIGNSVMSIGYGAFLGCRGLTNMTIGNNVTSIGEAAFYSCSGITNITIGNSVTSIESHTFYYCSSLISLTIPDSVTRIGWGAFYKCNNLKSLIFKGKTLEQVKVMDNYPFCLEDESIIKCKS